MDVDVGVDGTVQSTVGGPAPALVDSDRMDVVTSEDGNRDPATPVGATPGAEPTESTELAPAPPAQTESVPATQVVTEKDILDDNADTDLTKLRKHRAMEGASTTDDDFSSIFNACHCAAATDVQQFRDAHQGDEVAESSDQGIVAIVTAKLQAIVNRQEDYPVEELLSDWCKLDVTVSESRKRK